MEKGWAALCNRLFKAPNLAISLVISILPTFLVDKEPMCVIKVIR